MVIDTSVLIDYLRAKDKSQTMLQKTSKQTAIYISAITLFELYSGVWNPKKKIEIEQLLDGILILPFTSEVAKKAGQIFYQLQQQGLLIGVADILIAATCLDKNLPILTLN